MTKKLAACSMAAVLMLSAASSCRAQEEPDEVRAVVGALFDAMRQADSAAVRGLFHPQMQQMASSGESSGVPSVGFGEVGRFVQMVGAAEPGALDERIGPPEIRIDDHLATVFTPYAFYYNGNLSHCGVNVFLLARVGEDWRIVGLADTRRRQGCEEWLK
jgi:hypothetical protein